MLFLSTATVLSLVAHSWATVITSDPAAIAASYDFIIVGGGTTALSVANRLSVHHTVLAIERGLDEMNAEGINDPFTPFSATSGSVTCHQNRNAQPQLGSAGPDARTLLVTYGNCLGGGSSINALIGTRPTKAGMDAVEALGNEGWCWEDFLPFLEKSETFAPPDREQTADGATFNASVHGFHGPVGVSFAKPLIAPQLQAASKTTTQSVYGMTLSKDLGDGFSGGHFSSFYHHIHFNKTLGVDRRSSSAWSYLYPQTQQRAGLTVLTQHVVDKLATVKSKNGKVTVTGVSAVPSVGGDSVSFSAKREVVVSAGALFSPGVLLRSGIGPASELKELGITPVIDLPGVGSNFQDQTLLVNISFPLRDPTNTAVTGTEVLLGIVLGHATGDNAFGLNGNKMIASAVRSTSADTALQLGGVVNRASFATQANVTANAFEINHPMIEIFFTPGGRISLWTQSIMPMSRGTVKINSTDPLAFPLVNAEYLTADVDIQVFTQAARLLGKTASTSPYKDLLTADAYTLSGLPAVDASDDEWKTWMLDHYTPGVHFVGSNSMLPKELGGVVSPQLIVYGTTNLRVADASILPLSVFPHTTLGLYGIGEKAADMILKSI